MEERRRKRTYYVSFAAALATIVASAFSFFWLVCWAWNLKHASPILPLFYAVSPILAGAHAIAVQVCRRRGFVMAKSASQEVARAESQGSPVPAGRRVVGPSRRGWGIFAGLSTLAAAGFTAGAFLSHGLGGPEAFATLAVAAGLISILSWWAAFTDAGSHAEVNDTGIAYRTLFGHDIHPVPWDRVAECRVERTRDEVGRTTAVTCTLRSAEGLDLARLVLRDGPTDRRLLAAIQARQGLVVHTELESAPPPEGTGTELEAAPALAGRGTELESGEASTVSTAVARDRAR